MTETVRRRFLKRADAAIAAALLPGAAREWDTPEMMAPIRALARPSIRQPDRTQA